MVATDLKQMDLDYVLHTYGRNYTHFVRGSGAKLFDDSGRDYIDFGAGIAVCSVGHGNERLANAICKQARELIHTSNLYLIEPQAKFSDYKKVLPITTLQTQRYFHTAEYGNPAQSIL